MPWAPDYVDAATLAAYVRVEDVEDEAEMSVAIAAASRAIDHYTHRQFGSEAAPVARYYTARWDAATSRWVVHVDDIPDADGVEVHVDTDGDGTFSTAITGFTLGPRNALPDGVPYTRISAHGLVPTLDSVRVTARFGWASVPKVVEQACLLQASRLLARRDAPFGVTGSPDAGGELRLLAKIDPDVAVLLRPVARRWWFA